MRGFDPKPAFGSDQWQARSIQIPLEPHFVKFEAYDQLIAFRRSYGVTDRIEPLPHVAFAPKVLLHDESLGHFESS